MGIGTQDKDEVARAVRYTSLLQTRDDMSTMRKVENTVTLSLLMQKKMSLLNLQYPFLSNCPFPENSSFVIEIPKDFKDDADRSLSNADKYPLKVKTDAYPPLAKFSSRFGIIELKGDVALPVTLRNLEPEVSTRLLKINDKKQIAARKAKEGILNGTVKLGEALTSVLPDSRKQEPDKMVDGLKGRLRKLQMNREEKAIEWLRAVASAGRQRWLKGTTDVREFGVPKPGGGKAFEVVGIPLKGPGLYVVEMESRILGSALLGESADPQDALQKQPIYVPTAALVTNLGVHFKQGRESSLVWVTSLDKAKPVLMPRSR